MRFRSISMLAIPMLLTAGCGLAGSGQTAVGGNGVGVAEPGVAGPGGPMPWPECQTGDYAFAGESTLGAIGLGDFAGGPDANRVGMIWVTAGPASLDVPMPEPAGGGKGVPVGAARMVCVQWPDGSGMAGNIPDDWVLPAGVAGSPAPDEEAAAPLPIGVLTLVGGAIVLVGVSVLAFRREGA